MAVFCLFKELKNLSYILREARRLIRCEYSVPTAWKLMYVQQCTVGYCCVKVHQAATRHGLGRGQNILTSRELM